MSQLSAPDKLNITTATTTVVYSGRCVLESVVVNNTAAGTIIIYDNTAASGTKVGTLPASAAVGPYFYGCYMSNGITLVTGAAYDVTVTFTPLS